MSDTMLALAVREIVDLRGLSHGRVEGVVGAGRGGTQALSEDVRSVHLGAPWLLSRSRRGESRRQTMTARRKGLRLTETSSTGGGGREANEDCGETLRCGGVVAGEARREMRIVSRMNDCWGYRQRRRCGIACACTVRVWVSAVVWTVVAWRVWCVVWW